MIFITIKVFNLINKTAEYTINSFLKYIILNANKDII